MRYIWSATLDETDHQHIKIIGKNGHWSALEKCETEEATYYLYQHDVYGLTTPYIIIKYVDEQPIETFDSYYGVLTFLESEGIIEQ